MTKELEVTTETTVTIKLSGTYADRLAASLGRTLAVIDHVGTERYEQLVNTNTIDDLLDLKTALYTVTG
jgi:hypothetical protein